MSDFIVPFSISFNPDQIQYSVEAYRKLLEAGTLQPGFFIEQLEEKLAAMHGVKHCIAVGTGTMGLEIIFRAYGVEKALVPSVTNIATASALVAAGGIPVFYDGGLFPSFDSIKRSFRDNPDVDTLVLVHLGGILTPEIDEISRWCEENRLRLLTDGAHAMGAKDGHGNSFMSYGSASILSFFRTKVVGACEGGCILTNDDLLAQESRIYRDQGKAQDGLTNIRLGGSWRMHETAAPLLIAQCDSFSQDNGRRQEILKIYHDSLVGKEGISLLMNVPTLVGANGYKMVIAVDDRPRLIDYLADRGIGCSRGIYDIPLHEQPVCQRYVGESQVFPLAERFARTHVCIPVWKGLMPEEQERVVVALLEYQG